MNKEKPSAVFLWDLEPWSNPSPCHFGLSCQAPLRLQSPCGYFVEAGAHLHFFPGHEWPHIFGTQPLGSWPHFFRRGMAIDQSWTGGEPLEHFLLYWTWLQQDTKIFLIYIFDLYNGGKTMPFAPQFIDGMITIPSISRSFYVVYGIVLPTLLCLVVWLGMTSFFRQFSSLRPMMVPLDMRWWAETQREHDHSLRMSKESPTWALIDFDCNIQNYRTRIPRWSASYNSS